MHLKVTLADQQQDPNSPLFSVKSFEELGLCVIVPRFDQRAHYRPDYLIFSKVYMT
jgi:hypothetical protein